jgi:hypothetical protein
LAIAVIGAVVLGCGSVGSAQVDADTEPCVLITASDVEEALGITDADGTGSKTTIGGVNVCTYTGSDGASVQVNAKFASDGGKALKGLCKAAKTRTGYQSVKKVGTTACYYRQGLLGSGPEFPNLLMFALQARSSAAGWMVQLRLQGPAAAVDALAPEAVDGLSALGRDAAQAVKDRTIKVGK